MSVKIQMSFLGWALLLASACGEEPPDLPDAGPTDGGVPASLFPLEVGNQWTYRVTKGSGGVATKVQTVTGTISTEAGAGFRFTTEEDGVLEVESVQREDGRRLVRVSETEYKAGVKHRLVDYDPPAVRIDSSQTTPNTRYVDAHTKRTYDAAGTLLLTEPRTHEFIVEAEGELVEVAAGTFRCVRVRRTRSGPETEKTYWYAPGVGKVKEAGGQTEELTSFTLAP